MPATPADSFRRLGQVEQGDHCRRPFLATRSAHRLIMILGKEFQAAASIGLLAAFGTTSLLGFPDQANGVTIHTIAPIVRINSFIPSHVCLGFPHTGRSAFDDRPHHRLG